MNTLRNLMAGILMLLALITVPVPALAAIDTMQPTTSATLMGTKGSDGWYTTSVTVTLAAADGADGSGVAKIEYSLDNVTWQTYSAPFVLDKDGDQYVFFRSTDNAGNLESPAKSQEIKVNKTGLVGLWHMDGDWRDASVVRNEGIPYGSVAFGTPAKVGTFAGNFDGINDGVKINDNEVFAAMQHISIEAWIKPSRILQSGSWSTSRQTIVSFKESDGINVGAILGLPENATNKFQFWVKVNGVWLAVTSTQMITTPIDPSLWYHVAGSYDGSLLKIYVNGKLDGTSYAPGIMTNAVGSSTCTITIGARASNNMNWFQGLIDEVAIYNRSLSDAEVQEHYRSYVVNSPTVNPVTSPTTTSIITLSGTKPANTAIVVNGSTLVSLDGTTSWQTSYTLSQGMNAISVTALDGQNHISPPVALTVVLDTTPPAAPTINPVFAPINTTIKTITGTRSSDSATVAVSCAGATIGTISYPTTTTWSVDFSGLKEGNNTITAYALDTAGNHSATATVTITVDTTPPAVGATPAGGIYKSTQFAALAANEQAVIYYTTNGSTPTVNSSRYSQPISIPASATLKYFGRDLAGNNSEIKTENYVLDTVPPVLAISTLSNGAYTNNETLNIAGTVTDDVGVKGITVNDTAVQVNADGSFSYALLLKNGVNIITIAATDSAGNMATDMRTVTLDQTAPVLAVTTPSDNSKSGKMLLEVSGTVDKTSTVTVKMKNNVQSAVMNGGDFAATIILEPGYNTIEITAADLAGNQSSLKRTVVFDDQEPSLALTVPSQDIRTNQSSLIIKGMVSDALTAVGVTISKDNEMFTPPVIDGTFEQAVNFTEEKTYGIVVTATNEVGSSTSVQRNVIYDITPPVLGFDPVPSPTSRPSLPVSGTREAGTAVTVTSATATVGEVSYPTATTWQADISGLREGDNVITAVSADAAGNAVTAKATVVLVSRLPEITVKATPDVIWPPNHQIVSVTIAGGVEAYGSDIKSVSISVTDEYGKYEYNNLTFGSSVMLEAWRNGNDTDGRKYTITVVVTDKGGITTTKRATVTVPHDESKLK
jgi:hypothetical protein